MGSMGSGQPDPMALDIAKVTANTVGGELRLAVEGELEIGTVGVLRDAVVEALDAGERRLVVDLAPTTFVDSTGLGGLLEVSRDVALRDGTLAVLAPHGHEARLLIELSGTGGALGLRPD